MQSKAEMVTTNLSGMEESAKSWMEIDNQISALKKQIKALEKKKEPFEKAFKEKMEAFDIGTLDGWEVQWKRVPTHGFNSTRFQKDYPKLYAQYYEEKPPRRQFKVVVVAEVSDTGEFNF